MSVTMSLLPLPFSPRLLSIISLMTFIVVSPAVASTTQPRNMQELRRAVMDKMGGTGHVESIRSIRFDGTLEANGNEVGLRIVKKRPNFMRVTSRYNEPNITVNTGYNGKQVWSMVERGNQQSARFLEGKEASDFIANARFLIPILDSNATHLRTEFIGLEEFREKSYYRVNIVRPNGNDSISYIDPEEFLEIYSVNLNEDGEIASVVHMEDFREVNRLWIPFKQTSYTNDEVTGLLSMSNAEVGVGVFDFYFNPPASLENQSQ